MAQASAVGESLPSHASSGGRGAKLYVRDVRNQKLRIFTIHESRVYPLGLVLVPADSSYSQPSHRVPERAPQPVVSLLPVVFQ